MPKNASAIQFFKCFSMVLTTSRFSYFHGSVLTSSKAFHMLVMFIAL